MYLKSWYKFGLKTNIRKFLQFSLKQVGFLHALSPWVHGRRLRPLQPPVPLPAARRNERVNDEPVKVALFYLFLLKMSRNFEKLQFFSFGLTQCFYLTHSVREYFEKLALKKNKKCSFKRLHFKSYDEFRVKINIFRKFIQFSFKQDVFLHAVNKWVHGRPLRPLVPLPGPRGAERVNYEPVKVLNLLFFTSFFWK